MVNDEKMIFTGNHANKNLANRRQSLTGLCKHTRSEMLGQMIGRPVALPKIPIPGPLFQHAAAVEKTTAFKIAEAESDTNGRRYVWIKIDAFEV